MTDKWKTEARQEIEQRIGMGIEQLPGDKEWVYETMRSRARVLRLEAHNRQLREALTDAQPFVLAHSAVHASQSGRPIGECHPIHQEIIDKIDAALAATEPKP